LIDTKSNDLDYQNKGFMVFCDFKLQHTLQEWISPKLPETKQDNLRIKISAMNVDFNTQQCKSRPPSFKDVCTCRHQKGYPYSHYFTAVGSSSMKMVADIDLLHTITKTSDKPKYGLLKSQFGRIW